jgi:hypothetical protein
MAELINRAIINQVNVGIAISGPLPVSFILIFPLMSKEIYSFNARKSMDAKKTSVVK